MGLLDKVKGLFSGHEDQAKSGVDKAADVADDKTGGQHSDKIDTAADKAKEGIDKITGA